MTDIELADELIKRLNALIHSNQDIRKDIDTLTKTYVHVSRATGEHPTLQCFQDSSNKEYLLGLLGVLNGIVGVIPEGKKEGFGYIAAIYDYGKLQRFERTDSLPEEVPCR